MEAIFPEGGPGKLVGRAEVEAILDGQYVMRRTTVEDPIPDSAAIISAHPDSGTFTHRYFDSRGVVRLYAMTFGRSCK